MRRSCEEGDGEGEGGERGGIEEGEEGRGGEDGSEEEEKAGMAAAATAGKEDGESEAKERGGVEGRGEEGGTGEPDREKASMSCGEEGREGPGKMDLQLCWCLRVPAGRIPQRSEARRERTPRTKMGRGKGRTKAS